MINYLSKPFKWFFKLEAASGLVLLFAAIIALIISNSNFSDLYFNTLNSYLFIGINKIGLKEHLSQTKVLVQSFHLHSSFEKIAFVL